TDTPGSGVSVEAKRSTPPISPTLGSGVSATLASAGLCSASASQKTFSKPMLTARGVPFTSAGEHLSPSAAFLAASSNPWPLLSTTSGSVTEPSTLTVIRRRTSASSPSAWASGGYSGGEYVVICGAMTSGVSTSSSTVSSPVGSASLR